MFANRIQPPQKTVQQPSVTDDPKPAMYIQLLNIIKLSTIFAVVIVVDKVEEHFPVVAMMSDIMEKRSEL